MAIVVSDDGKFEWDSEKDEANFRKHGFHFAEILEVFDDGLYRADKDKNNFVAQGDGAGGGAVL